MHSYNYRRKGKFKHCQGVYNGLGMRDIILRLRLLFLTFGFCTIISAGFTFFVFDQSSPLKDRIVNFYFIVLGPISVLITANEFTSFLFYLQWILLVFLCAIGMLSCLFEQNIVTAFITIISILVWFAYGLGLHFISV